MKSIADAFVFFFLFCSGFFLGCLGLILAESFDLIDLDRMPVLIGVILQLFVYWYICFPIIFFGSGIGLGIFVQRLFKNK